MCIRDSQYGIVVNGAVKWEDIGHLRENLPDDITLNHNEDYGLLALQGPKAVTALARLVPEAAGLVFMQATRATWNGHGITISRSGYTGEDGFEISLPNEALTDFADALCAMDEVKPIGLGARDSLRLEAGLPLYGHDLDPTIDPVEGDLAFAVSKRRREEGGFPGAARILGHLADGSPRKRVGLLVDGKMPVREGAKLFDGNTEIGVVTSGGFAPSVGAPIAMGYVPRDHAEPGTALAAFTDSTTAASPLWLSSAPVSGTSTNTMSPSWPCAKSVMPTVATSPSTSIHSCSSV